MPELAVNLGQEWNVEHDQRVKVNNAQMVERMASIAGVPRPSPWTRLWLRTVVEESTASDPAWNNGFIRRPRTCRPASGDWRTPRP